MITALKIKKHYAGFIILLVLAFTAVVRIRLLQFPLERDEGEYAYMGQLLLKGIVPFKLAFSTQKLPGTHISYALIMSVFGQSVGAIHFGLLLINLASCILVYFLAKRLFGTLAGVVACASFAILSVGQCVLGTAAHATHFVMLPVLGGLLLLMSAAKSGNAVKLYLCGLLFGTAFLMRQPALLFSFFGLICLWHAEMQRTVFSWRDAARRSAIYIVGVAVPFALLCALLAAGGSFQTFWFWTFTYLAQYASEITAAMGLQMFQRTFSDIVRANPGIWILAALGLVCLFADKKSRSGLFFTFGFFITSFLAVCPGFYFRQHYFVQLLPAAAILAGVAVSSTTDFFSRRGLPVVVRFSPVIVFVAALGFSLFQQRSFLFEQSAFQASRSTYGPNPFPEAVEIAKYVKANTTENDRIAVIGSEPEIYFYANRYCATGYIFTYALMEPRPLALKMQKEMIADIESTLPKYLVVVNVRTSWLQQQGSNLFIFSWLPQFLDSHYEITGVADILSKEKTEYHWDADAANYRAQSKFYMTVWKAKSRQP